MWNGPDRVPIGVPSGFAGALILLALACAVWLWWPDVPLPRAVAPPPATSQPRTSEARVPVAQDMTPMPDPARPDVTADPVSAATDLRRVFDDHIASPEPRERRIAARAFEACIPAFLPNPAETPSPEPLIQALPAAGRAERATAYWALFARCQRFFSERRESIAAMQAQLQRDALAQDPGVRAQEALLAGRLDEVGPLVAEALRGADPAAVASLSGMAVRLAQRSGTDAANAARMQRGRVVDAALPWLACDLGLECGAQSLQALQLCAVQGLCEGDVRARVAARMAADAIVPAALEQERQRLAVLVRSGRPLTIDDLLPPQQVN
jgi:hypothetical protein